MIGSLRVLLASPYNKKHIFSAFKRFFQWKSIRLGRKLNVRYTLWGDRIWLLDYDSLQSMWIMYNYILDWEEFKLIENYVNPGDQVMDIGANVGAYTVWMSKFISAPGRIHAFEPDEKSFTKLQAHIAVNNMGNLAKATRCALSDTDGVLNFTTGLDRLNHITAEKEANSVSVDSCTLDHYCEMNGISRIAYMKVDVEGFEYMVLKGAVNLFSSKAVDILQMEINDTVRHAGVSVEDLLGLLKGYQYSLCRFDVDSNQLVPIEYYKERENYFAVTDLAGVNSKLRS